MLEVDSLTCLLTGVVELLTNYKLILNPGGKKPHRICVFVGVGGKEFVFMFGFIIKPQICGT